MVVNPIGYISKTGVEGMRSLIGPRSMVRFLKSMTLGGCIRSMSREAICREYAPGCISMCYVTP
jgi:hypothetical protein